MTLSNISSPLYINAEWCTPKSGEFEDIINPATEEAIGQAAVGGLDDIEHAIASSKDAYDQGTWPRMSIAERVTVLWKFHDHLAARKAELIDLIVQETGTTKMLAEFMQFELPMKHTRALLNDALKIEPKFAPLELTPSMDGRKILGTSVTTHVPCGVVAAITAYNFPLFLNLSKVFHALIMGNTCILKPSPYTPLLALVLGQAADAAGLPAGVLNIVTANKEASEVLTTDPRIAMVSFTGSDLVGSAIMAQAAPTLKKLHFELGGKSALIIRPDANIQEALKAALMGFTIHAGQGCALTTRLIVHNDIRAEFVAQLAAMAAGMSVGNPADPSVQMGPLIRQAALERVENYVSIALDEGAKLVAGGHKPTGLDKGFYYSPTLFDNVDNQSRLAQEEIFGPVGAVIGFDTDEQAIELANDSQYGLGGGIFSADVGHAYEMALQIHTGTLSINGGGGTMLSSSPFGGVKRSGFGREYGADSLLEFSQAKAISFHGG
ncbi:MAG: aldehyde dehydrogenase family protein [Arenicella sp.]|jgi:aldehyde dehydrogenase (NAD+)|nr:aldehyde dehydrogenase family protein [Arenicella sp.]